jgi:hypothetical protein
LAFARSRDAIARSSVSAPFFIPGKLTLRAKRLAPRMPQRTGARVPETSVVFAVDMPLPFERPYGAVAVSGLPEADDASLAQLGVDAIVTTHRRSVVT